uniref:C-type lectin domain-containing protein n=1 Tax=Mastacembelus armatus TaxID=205130 RepID=A0A3Q3MTC8_9TELE
LIETYSLLSLFCFLNPLSVVQYIMVHGSGLILNIFYVLFLAEKSCPAGWTMFRCSCYLLSTQAGSWDKGRQDCRDREAELVTIDSYEEQVFVSALNEKDTWLGLNDIETEGTWKWADGTALTVKYWFPGEPNNANGDPQYGEEDCGHLYHATKADGNWNDLRCNSILQWICEKMA